MFHPAGPTLLELARQALSSTRGGYDLLAPKFDHTPFRTPDPLIAAAMHFVSPSGQVDRGLDLCCGTGAVLHQLRPRCRQRVMGVDFSEGMLRQARVHLEGGPGDAELELVQADVCRLRVEAPFDVATCFGALGHIPDAEREDFIAAVADALRPGGRLLFPTVFLPPWWSRRALLSRAFNGAMHLRNALWPPPFIMYYLRFVLPEVLALLGRHGFIPEVRALGAEHDAALRLVIAVRR